MAAKNKAQEAAKAAAQHHTTLSMLDAAATILNGSDMHHTTHKMAERLTRAIRKEQYRQLRLYDKALARIAGLPAVDSQTNPPADADGGGE